MMCMQQTESPVDPDSTTVEYPADSPPPQPVAASPLEQASGLEPVSPPSSTGQARKKVLLIGGIGVLCLLVLSFIVWSRVAGSSSTRFQSTHEVPVPQTQTIDQENTVQEVQPGKPVLSGSLKQIDRDLQLFLVTRDDVLNGRSADGTYYEAGTFLEGPYQGYTRIIALKDTNTPSGILSYTLATKDFQTFVLDDSDGFLGSLNENDWRYPYHFLEKSKISQIDTLDTEQPQELPLSQAFSLFLETQPFSEPFFVQSVQTDQVDKFNNKIYSPRIMADFSDYKSLESPYAHLQMYAAPYQQNADYYNELTDQEKQAFQVRNRYFVGTTEVLVVDSTGLPVRYSLTRPDAAEQYQSELAVYKAALKRYQDSYDATTQSYALEYPNIPALPGMGFAGSAVRLQTNQQLFKQYQVAVPEACAGSSNTRVMNMSDQELEQVGTINTGTPVYRLVDDANPLYGLEYDLKFGYYDREADFWQAQNKGLTFVDQNEYVRQLPLLFTKDYWNRWVAVGEYDYQVAGGCGKPVIYLYPEKPTDVQVSLLAPVQFTTDIPTYQNGWRVLAEPNGSLTNLLPELTDCQQFSPAQFGSEYAAAACHDNTYPYLYWSGSVTSIAYPHLNEGWIVGQSELQQFFDTKLAAMGFNQQEVQDFASFWVPTLHAKDAPYFKISFFQTKMVNQLFPLRVNPQPDSMLRMFMDYTPLESMPANFPLPQQLQKVERTGFTLVEWGGLE